MSKKQRILAVDDEYINLFILQECLSERFDIELVEDGLACLEAVERQRPDIILLDIRMPVMDGIETCKRLKNDPNTQQIPILCLSALSMPHQINEGLEAGADAYINKPFKTDQLLLTIEKYLA